MGALAPALPYISAMGTAFSFVSQIQAGNAAEQQAANQAAIYNMQAQNAQVIADRNAMIAEDNANYSAARDREQAGQEEAASQRAAKEKRRQTNIAISNARADAGASGGGATDPTVLDLYGDIAELGEYDAATSLYEGSSAASLLRSQAALTEYTGKSQADMIRYGGATDASLLRYSGQVAMAEGKAAKNQAYMSAVGTAIGGVANIASKYAPNKLNSSYIPKQSARYYLSEDEYIDWD